MLHDIYRVVLLELGLWRPQERYGAKLSDNSPQGCRQFLLELAEETEVFIDRRYKELAL